MKDHWLEAIEKAAIALRYFADSGGDVANKPYLNEVAAVLAEIVTFGGVKTRLEYYTHRDPVGDRMKAERAAREATAKTVRIIKPDVHAGKMAIVTGERFKYPGQDFWVTPVRLRGGQEALAVEYEEVSTNERADT